jgi:hypothetical protein
MTDRTGEPHGRKPRPTRAGKVGEPAAATGIPSLKPPGSSRGKRRIRLNTPPLDAGENQGPEWR